MEKVKMSPKKKALLIVGIVLGSLLLLVGLVLLGLRAYMRWPVSDYYKASEKAFVIPGLGDDFVPQGFCYDEEKDHFLLSGYSSSNAASPIYVVDRESGELKKTVLLAEEDGAPFTGHAGGVAIYNDYVYVAGGSDQCLFVFSYAELLAAEEGGSVRCKGEFSVKVSDTDYLDVSFVTVYEDRIILGEFYYEPAYPTLDSHKITTAAGDKNNALAVEFALLPDAEFGIDQTPLKAYSMREKVQGLCVTEDKIYLSTSWGLGFSYLYEYDRAKLASEGTINVLGAELPLISLDSASLSAEYKIPPMSEELVMLDGRMYVMCESACNKYIFGKFTSGKWCYSTDLSEMK